jgi:hypothetical protein
MLLENGRNVVAEINRPLRIRFVEDASAQQGPNRAQRYKL